MLSKCAESACDVKFLIEHVLFCCSLARNTVLLSMENEKLQEENARLRELLGLMQPRPEEPHAAAQIAAAAGCAGGIGTTGAARRRQEGAASNRDGGTGRDGGTAAAVTRGLRREACSVALRHESLLRSRAVQLERQVLRQQEEIQA